ncbi:hypothetical protein BH20ACT9_BH20ACT9_12080 [soil metagenome]
MARIRRLHTGSDGTYGSPRITRLIRDYQNGIQAG